MAVLKSVLKGLFKETLEELYTEADLHQLPRKQVEDRILDKAKKILGAQTLEEAQEYRRKALSSMSIHCSFLMTLRKRFTPRTPDRLLKMAKKAESLAGSMERQGKHKDAVKQKARAAKLRKEAECITSTAKEKASPS